MKLSPLDIRKQDFDSALRGYSKDDVEAFLQMVSRQWEDLLEEERRLEDRVRTLQGKLEHYEAVEGALHEALQTARENSEQKLENAEKRARLTVQEAEARADEITREAREDRELLRRQVDQLQARRDKGVATLRAFLMSQMELLLRFDGEDPEALRESLPDQLAQHVSEGALPTGEPDERSGVPEREDTQPTGNATEEPAPRDDFDEHSSPAFGAETEASPSEPPPSPASSTPAPGDDLDGADELTDFLRQYETERIHSQEPAVREPHADAGAPPAADVAAGVAEDVETTSQEPPSDASAEGAPPDDDAGVEEAAPEPLQAPMHKMIETERETAPTDFAGENGTTADEEDLTATADEIDKIRRILNDME